MSEILARPDLRKEQLRIPQNKRIVPAKQHGTWLTMSQSSKSQDKTTSCSPVDRKAPIFFKDTRSAYVCDRFGASMHVLSKKDLSSDELDTLRRSINPVTVVTANGKVQTNEDAQEHVRDLDLFVTGQLLDNTPAG